MARYHHDYGSLHNNKVSNRTKGLVIGIVTMVVGMIIVAFKPDTATSTWMTVSGIGIAIFGISLLIPG